MKKTAGILDILETLGVELTGMGVGAAIGAGGAALKGTAIGTAALTGAGLLATTPLGWAIIALTTAVSIGSIIYAATKTNDTLEDLIGFLDNLDVSHQLRFWKKDAPLKVKNFKEEWIRQLTGFKDELERLNMELSGIAPRTKEDEPKVKEQAATINAEIIEVMVQLLAYLTNIKNYQWPQVKASFTDIGLDVKQAEQSLNATTAAIQSNLANLKKVIQRESQAKAQKQVLQQVGSYRTLITEILKLHSEITSLWRQPPQYSQKEIEVIEIGKLALEPEEKIDANIMQSLNKANPMLNNILKELQFMLSEVKKRLKKSSKLHYISKRAVSLPGVKEIPEQMTGKKTVSLPKMPVVQNLQRYLNHLSVAADVSDAPYLKEDGQYGANTAKALLAVLNKFPRLPIYLKKTHGVPLDRLSDIKFMNDEAGGLRFVNLITSVLRKFAQYYAEATEKPKEVSTPKEISQRDTQPEGPVPADTSSRPRCELRKVNPTSQDVINCLHNTSGYKGNVRINMYDYMRSMGMSEDNMVILIYNLFGGAPSGSWSAEMIIRAIGSRYGG